MLFAHDTEVALTSAAALVNTGRGGTELLPDPASLDEFVQAWGWTGNRTHGRVELDAVRRLRARLERLWELTEDDAAELVNTLLREANALPQLVKHTSGTITCTRRRAMRRWPTGWRSRRRWRSPT